MNAIPRKQVLNEAFKEVQPLPDWPLAEMSEAKHLAEEDSPCVTDVPAGDNSTISITLPVGKSDSLRVKGQQTEPICR